MAMIPSDSLTLLMCVHSQDEAHDQYFINALQSVINQTYRDFKTVIVLNNCHERTREVSEYYMKLLDATILIKPDKTGLASAKNFGLRQINSEFVCYLDADNKWMPNKIEVQRQTMLSRLWLDFCFHQTFDLHENGEVTDNCFKLGQYESDVAIKLRLPVENCLAHDTAMIRMSKLRSLGLYDESKKFLGFEDYVLWQKAANAGCEFYNIPQRLSIHRLGSSVPR